MITLFKPKDDEAGFTIVELLISLSIFSLILLMTITTIENYTKDYYKVTLDSSVLSALQTVNDDVEQSIQSSPSLTLPGSNHGYNYFCTSSEEFLYNLGDEMPIEVPEQVPYALYAFPLNGNPCYTFDNPSDVILGQAAMTSGDGQSLLGAHYRITSFNIDTIPKAYGDSTTTPEWFVDIKIAYSSGGVNDPGDDLLCSPSLDGANGGCNPTDGPLSSFTEPDITCKDGPDKQFCDVSELKETVASQVSDM